MNQIFFSIGGINIYWYSILMIAAIYIGYLLAIKEARRVGIGSSFMSDLIFYMIPIGVIGARIYYVIFDFEYFKDNLLDIIKIWEGGIAIYGAVIAGFFFLVYYARKRGQPIFKTTDVIVPSLILGQAIGRWGNFFNGEVYGKEVSLAFLENLHLPQFIIDGMKINGVYYEPTFLYESLWCIGGFIILLIIRYLFKKNKVGTLTSLYFIWYGIGRFFFEGMRDETYSLMISEFRVSQLVSIALIILGIIGIIISMSSKKKYFNVEKEAENVLRL